MQQTQSVNGDWHASSFCSTGNCVEATRRGESVLVRDSKNPDVVQTYSTGDWHAFLDRITNGDVNFLG